MQYCAALSVITALRELVSNQDLLLKTNFKLKWPNDILCNGKKVSGILSESIWQSQHLHGMIVGIGVNVAQDSFNGLLGHTAISLKQAGITANVNEVREIILSALDSNLSQIAAMGRANADDNLIEQTRKELSWISNLGPFDMVINEEAVLRNMKYAGLSEHGALLLRHEDGKVEEVNAGSIEWSERTRLIVDEMQAH
jgi:BirA family biotin operon repressor/biotin-[acetyl-CoA-carboxylase] ligase